MAQRTLLGSASLPPLPFPLSFLDRFALTCGGAWERPHARYPLFWLAHAAAVTLTMLSGRSISTWASKYEVFLVMYPILLVAQLHSLRAARALLPLLSARVAAAGVAPAALFSLPLQPLLARLPRACGASFTRWAPLLCLALPLTVSSLCVLAFLLWPDLRTAASPSAVFLKEALGVALLLRIFAPLLLVLAALARLLRLAVLHYFERCLPGAARSPSAAVWLLPGLGFRAAAAAAPRASAEVEATEEAPALDGLATIELGGSAGAMPAAALPAALQPLPQPPPHCCMLSPEAALQELYGESDSTGLLHDALEVGGAISTALTPPLACILIFCSMNVAELLLQPGTARGVGAGLHALAAAAVGLVTVGGVMLVANSWFEPLRRWLRRQTPGELARAAQEDGMWAQGSSSSSSSSACSSCTAASPEAAFLANSALAEYFWTFLQRVGPLLQVKVLGLAVDQKLLSRLFMSWLLGLFTALLYSVIPQAMMDAGAETA